MQLVNPIQDASRTANSNAINIAIVIAVSNYLGETPALPACKRDGQAIALILQNENRFDDILLIDEHTTSKDVKDTVTQFIERFKNRTINDFIFYFTGHGEYDNGEFYYLLSDYQRPYRNRTSLQNSELDNLCRALKPRLFVKIVDACHSGITYIKNKDEIEQFLLQQRGQFEKLYFLFSSRSEQSSYQSSKFSDFTGSIVYALVSHLPGRVRYKEIIDYVSDEFEQLGHQTPTFIVKADFTETFCELSEPTIDGLRALLDGNPPPPKLAATETRPSIFESVMSDAATYCSREEAIEILEKILEKTQQFRLTGDIDGLFEVNCYASETVNAPNLATIGKWLDTNKGPTKLFAKPITTIQPVQERVLKDPWMNITRRLIGNTLGDDDYVTVTKNQKQITGFESTTTLNIAEIYIKAEPKFANLLPSECFIVPILSRTHLRFFWSFTRYDYIEWSRLEPADTTDWSTEECMLKDQRSIESLLSKITSNFRSFVELPIKQKWGDLSSTSSTSATSEELQSIIDKDGS